MTFLGKIFVQLENAPWICLVVLRMLRVDCIHFPRGTRGRKERAVEKRGKTR